MYKDHHKAWESTVRKAQLHHHHHHQPGRRRGCIFVPMSAVAPDADADAVPTTTTDSDSDSEEVYDAERLLPNGDFYTGQWSGQLPHGTGKYLWNDGCMYEGEWRRGKTMGRGKFSWPSGATYEGEFKAGFMDGFGTYTGSYGDTYRGFWSMNLKNGTGKKCYANGDYYDGEWRYGHHQGHGRYVWRNGSEYIGRWRAGLIHGRGSLVWANGNRYDGDWEDGSPRGSGSFRWADGSLYVGVWTREPTGLQQKQKGVYYPSPAATSPRARDPEAAFTVDLQDCKICPGETVSILPSQKTLSWDGPGAEAGAEPGESLLKQAILMSTQFSDPGSARPRRRASVDAPVPPRRPNGRIIGINSGGCGTGGQKSFDRICIWESDGDITCDIVDGSAVVAMEGADESIKWLRLDDADPRMVRTPGQQWRWLPKEIKKQGETISKGHKNYDLMLNLQLGIRHSVGKQQGKGNTSLDLKASTFDPKEKVWTKFPPEGFDAPYFLNRIIRTLHRLFKVDAADYMLSICGNDALRELSSPGKSGSFFYLTNDDRYMIKTVKKAEVKVLLRMLSAYYNHVRAFENTLVTKFFGLHCVKLGGATQKKVRFVIMGNLFCSEYPIHRRFDLKGSSHGRITDKSEAEIDENTTLKDLDLNFIFRLQRSWFQEFHRQVDRDCEFLEQERIMDYSLLVGLHFRDPRDMPSTEDIDNAKEVTRLSKADEDKFLCDITRWSAIRLGVNILARVEQTVRRSDNESQLIGEPTGEIYDVVLFFGIIDILQDYDISKKLEHAYKSIQYDPTSISAVDPKQYSKRFRDFIYKIFLEDT